MGTNGTNGTSVAKSALPALCAREPAWAAKRILELEAAVVKWQLIATQRGIELLETMSDRECAIAMLRLLRPHLNGDVQAPVETFLSKVERVEVNGT